MTSPTSAAAARWQIASQPRRARRTSSTRRTSPWTVSTSSCQGERRGARIRGGDPGGRRVSSIRAVYPAVRRRSTTCEPMKPAPPVTRTRISIQSRGKPGVTWTPRGYDRCMKTALIIIVAIIVLAVVAMLAVRAMQRRKAQREELRSRLSMEAEGHRQELEANAVKAREAEQHAEQHRQQFEEHRDEAERLRREAEENERLAEEHAATASELDGRSERARTAASRHDEHAGDVEERLGKL